MRVLVAVFAIISLQISLTSVSSKALPQDSTSGSNPVGNNDASSTEAGPPSNTNAPATNSPNTDAPESSDSNTIPPEPPSSSAGNPEPSSPSTETPKKVPPKRKPYYGFNCFGLFDIGNDYDSFLEFVNETSQKNLELFDRGLTALEKEIRPGTPLQKMLDWVLSLFNQGSKNNNKPNGNGNGSGSGNGKPAVKVTLPEK